MIILNLGLNDHKHYWWTLDQISQVLDDDKNSIF